MVEWECPASVKDQTFNNCTAFFVNKKNPHGSGYWVYFHFKAANCKSELATLFKSLLFSYTKIHLTYKSGYFCVHVFVSSRWYLNTTEKSINEDMRYEALCWGVCGCVGVLAGGWTRRTRVLRTARSPQGKFPLSTPHCELLFGLERQRHKAVCICHKYNPQWTWKRNTRLLSQHGLS